MKKSFWQKFVVAVLTLSMIISVTVILGDNTVDAAQDDIDWSNAINARVEATTLNAGDKVRIKFYLSEALQSAWAVEFYCQTDAGVFNTVTSQDITVNNETRADGCQVAITKDVDFTLCDETVEDETDINDFWTESVFWNKTCEGGIVEFNDYSYISNGHSHLRSDNGNIGYLELTLAETVDKVTIEVAPLEIYYINASGDDGAYGIDDGDDFEWTQFTLTAPAANTVTFGTEDKTVAPGEEFQVPLTITGNTGFNALRLDVTYDPLVCEYKSMELSEEFSEKISLNSIYEDPENPGEIHASFVALNDVTGTGDFATLCFQSKEDVDDGTTSNISIAVRQITNVLETTVIGTGTEAAITIQEEAEPPEEEYILGDVNNDGNIDLLDAVYVLQNYNEVREFTEAQRTAADVNKDGIVNLVDALNILKYYNGEINTF